MKNLKYHPQHSFLRKFHFLSRFVMNSQRALFCWEEFFLSICSFLQSSLLLNVCFFDRFYFCVFFVHLFHSSYVCLCISFFHSVFVCTFVSLNLANLCVSFFHVCTYVSLNVAHLCVCFFVDRYFSF